MAARVLVTGAAGYIGSVLCEHLLNAGHRVVALDTLLFAQQPHFQFCASPNYDFRFGDSRDERLMKELVKDVDVIIPLAAIVGAPACDRDTQMTQSTNEDAIRMLLKLRSPNQLIIYPNTNSGYGAATDEAMCTEDSPLNPISLYGRTKVAAELAVLNDKNGITLRLATVFGMSPRMRIDLLVNHFTYVAVTDSYIVIFEKDFRRNFIHVRDVADCMLHCIENSGKMAGRPYNLGLDSANMSKGDLALRIKEHVPNFYVHFAEVGSDPDKRDYLVSSARLAKAGFTAKRTLDDGIRELMKGYQMMRRLPHRNV